MSAPPVPITNSPPSATTAVQQYAKEYQNSFLQNQVVYRNIALTTSDSSLWKRAQYAAKLIDQYRDYVPFGCCMAICRRESGFQADRQATRRTGPAGDEYDIGMWQMKAKWDKGGKWHGLNKSQALDPVQATPVVMSEFRDVHKYLVMADKNVLKDLVLYTWLQYGAHAMGPGTMKNVQRFIETGDDRGESQKNGLAGTIIRCLKKFQGKMTLPNLMAPGVARMAAYVTVAPYVNAEGKTTTKKQIRTNEQGVWSLAVRGLDACVWERRRDAVLAGKVLVSETQAMIAQAIAQVNNSGQGAILEAFKAHGAGWSRAGNAVQETRQDKFKGAAQAGVDVKNQQMQQNANTIRLANAAELTGLLAPGGTIMVFNEKTGLWEP